MLAIAVALELMALVTMSGFGGLGLGLAALSLILVFAVFWITSERREEQLAHARRAWTYFLINDRLAAESQNKRANPLVHAPDATCRSAFSWLHAGIHTRRFRRSFGHN